MPSQLAYLRFPWLIIGLVLAALGLATVFAQQFRFDASSETLVVEDDPDLAAYERVSQVFGGDAFLFLTFAPHNGELISPSALQDLDALVRDVAKVEGVKRVFSILDVPLLKSPPVTLADLLEGFRTLRSNDADLGLAADELTSSPFFSELLITRDGTGTALKIDLESDDELATATAAVASLQRSSTTTGAAWDAALQNQRFAREAFLEKRAAVIEALRKIARSYQERGTLYLGGVPMIAADMITYVKSDLTIFGGAVIGLMVLALGFFFRRVRWVALPVLTAAVSVFLTIGVLGALEWQATVISSNFVSLLGITTISLTIHLIVQYREQLLIDADMSGPELVHSTMRIKFAPCFYTALTTIAAFGSLTVSGILPVEYFGWMMCLGIVVSFVVTYTLFPAVLLLLPKGRPAANLAVTNNFIRAVGEFARWRPLAITLVAGMIAIAAYVGVSRVSLDNRFAEYFDTDTEIYQGMRYIDENLGGTIPFDVVLKFAPYEPDAGGFGDADDDAFADEDAFADPGEDPFAEEDAFEDPFAEDDDFADGEVEDYPEKYWFSRNMLDDLARVHRFVDTQPQVGKLLSLTLLEDFALEFIEGEKLSNLQIVAILGAIPAELRSQLIDPYASPATGELRLSGRIIESGPSFDREAFRQEILRFGVEEVQFAPADVQVTGMMVLFNSMLSQLLDSQISTLTYILAVVFVMFLVLLKSLRYALLGMVPNTLASATVIGAMGFSGIPLDMMTTTIAAICIGIGVDDTIHYLHRFSEEYKKWGDARVAVSFAHASIGRALNYTSLTVMIGFSVLCFSSFVPTVMFGLWTAVAMLLALLANLTLLPALLVLTHGGRPQQPELRNQDAGPVDETAA
ncbi:MAG: MMPL family transporter [Pseudomonadota bacterium]